MDHTKVLKRAWQLLWQYRTLWVFGFLLALTSAGASSQSNYSMSGDEFRDERGHRINIEPGQDFGEAFEDVVEAIRYEMVADFNRAVPAESRQLVINVLIAAAVVIVLLFIAGRFLEYIARTSLIRMVDEVEETGKTYTFREGFRLGWSRQAWRLFLIDLTINLPIIALFLAFLSLVISSFVSSIGSANVVGAVGVLSSIGLFLLVIFFTIILTVVFKALKNFMHRACVIDDLGVFPSIRQGFSIVRQNLKDVGIMWLIMVGITIGWLIILFPVGLVLFGLAFVFGGGVVLTLGSLTGAFAGAVGGIIATAITGGLIFVLLVVIPVQAINGLLEAYQSSAWTLTFRELRALKSLENGDAAKLEGAPAK